MLLLRAEWALGAVVLFVSAVATAQSLTGYVAGRIAYRDEQLPFPAVAVEVEPQLGSALFSATDESGQYQSPNLTFGQAVQVQPLPPTPEHSGVTALDAVYILMDVVGVRSLSADERLACDVNGSGTLSAVDASYVLQYAVGLIDRLPVAELCGSDWLFQPDAATLPLGAVAVAPGMVGGFCQPGTVLFDSLTQSAAQVNFRAVKFGDCTGDWRPASLNSPTSTPQPSATPTISRTPSITLTFTPSKTATRTPTATVTSSATRSSTPTRTETPTATATFSSTSTRTASPTPTPSATLSSTPTKSSTSTPTVTPTASATPTVTSTADCSGSDASTVNRPLLVMSHPDVADSTGVIRKGRAHVVNVVPTSSGWGVFWLRDTTENTLDIQLTSMLYYAHVNFDHQLTAGPIGLVPIHRHDREPLYLVAWRNDHFGLLINELVSTDVTNKITYQYYYDVSVDGVLSSRVGPIRTDLGYSGGIGDIIPYLDGFMVGIETVCQGSHQCSFAYKLADHGSGRGSDLHVVEFDGTHSFAPHMAYDGNGLAVVSWKDSLDWNGGVVTQYVANPGTYITASQPIVPNKGSLNDNNPRIAWDGQHFAAAWREVQSLYSPGNSQWRMRMATFSRNASTSTLVTDQFLEPSYVLDTLIARSLSFTTDLSAVPGGWVVGYARGRSGGEPEGVVDYRTPSGGAIATWPIFTLDDYAFSARGHFAGGYDRTIGVAASHRSSAAVEVRFSTLNLDCPP